MPPADPAIPPQDLARLTAAEARLYPMAMTDAASYQRAIAVVGVVLDELRERATTIADVLQQRDALITTLPHLASNAALELGGLPSDAVVDAASAVRCRELQAAAGAAARQAAIEAARAAGEEWFVVEASPDEVMAGSYRRAELHLATGATLITSIEAAPGSPIAYSIELYRADEAMPAEKRRYPERETWAAAVEAIRAEFAGAG